MDERRHAPKGGNVHRGAPAGTGSGSKLKSKGCGGGKKPIKVVYIGNPMRVTTSAEGFRALVQELTGCHADPSKYTGQGAGSPVTNVVDDYSLQSEPQPGALPSPGGSGTTEEASNVTANANAAAAGQVPPQASEFDDDDESFMPQLIDNSYCVFSPPTFLYGHYNNELV
jgi:hypothetical protein